MTDAEFKELKKQVEYFLENSTDEELMEALKKSGYEENTSKTVINGE